MKSVEESMKGEPGKGGSKKSSGTARMDELEKKLDLILKYSKKTHRWIMIKGIIGLLMFITFVVLPIVGTYYLWDFIQANVDFGQLSETYQNLNQGLGQLDQLGNFGNLLNGLGQ